MTGALQYTWESAEDGDEEGGPVPMTAPVRASDWQLWPAEETERAGEPLASGVTDGEGAFEACVDGELPDSATLRFPASSQGLWQVVDDIGGQVHAFSVPVTGSDLGTLDVPAQEAGAWKIVDVTDDFYAARATGSACWTAAETEDCTPLTFVWAAGREDGGYFDVGGSDSPILAGEDAASRHTIVHEAGHWWQWLLYGGRFPRVTGCTPHFVEKPSSPSCGWTEGFADAVAAHVLGDRVYVHGTGYVSRLDGPDGEGGPAWPGGATTQGNVGAALLDLWQLREGWEEDIAAMTGEPSADLAEYVTEDRPAAGLPLDGDVRKVLRRHTTDD